MRRGSNRENLGVRRGVAARENPVSGPRDDSARRGIDHLRSVGRRVFRRETRAGEIREVLHPLLVRSGRPGPGRERQEQAPYARAVGAPKPHFQEHRSVLPSARILTQRLIQLPQDGRRLRGSIFSEALMIEVRFPGGRKVEAAFDGYRVVTDQPASSGGDGVAPSPFDLFLASVATRRGILRAPLLPGGTWIPTGSRSRWRPSGTHRERRSWN